MECDIQYIFKLLFNRAGTYFKQSYKGGQNPNMNLRGLTSTFLGASIKVYLKFLEA